MVECSCIGIWVGIVLMLAWVSIECVDHGIVVVIMLGMARIVHVHHVDKDAFLRGNIEPDLDELDLVFERTPTYDEVLEQLRIELKWMDPNDFVELEGRHNVGFGMHVHSKTMRIFSKARW